MNENFAQSLTPKTTAMNATSNAGVATGFLAPSSQGGSKPANSLFTSSPAGSSSAPKTASTGAPTLFSNWPTNTTPTTPSTTANFTSFKPNSGTTTASTLSFKTPSTSMQGKPSSSSTPLTTGGTTLNTSNPVTTIQNMPTFGIPATIKPTVTTAVTSLSFNTTKSTASSTVTASNQPNSAVTSVAPSLNLTSSTTTSTTAVSTSSLTSKPPTSTATASQPQNLTFQQLEELILNKWTAELYEQEKVFLNQATQINIWDKIINENAEKLTQLHTTMEKVKKLQTKINDDLEVIFNHQKDLESCLVPMEKEDLLSVLKADPNRKNLYSNAKKIDSQIKSMSENLKETIEHINETSRSHDTEDPVIQVGRILNAHMESLRWIDEHTARMQDYFDSLLKIHDDLRRECDLNKHDVY